MRFFMLLLFWLPIFIVITSKFLHFYGLKFSDDFDSYSSHPFVILALMCWVWGVLDSIFYKKKLWLILCSIILSYPFTVIYYTIDLLRNKK
jgi:hypothetical protein